MQLVVNPVGKLGSLHIRPDWRYDLLQNPAKYKMQGYISTPTSGAGALKRFLPVGLEYEVNYTIPEYLKPYFEACDTPEEESVLFGLWNRAFKKQRQPKITVETSSIFKHNPVWNLSKVPKIQEEFLKRLIYHVSNFKYDHAIAGAIAYHDSLEHTEIFKFIGYGIYAGVSDKDLAKRWRMTVKQAEAIRLLFFDFSRFPKDRTANFTYLRQLANVGLFNDVDFAFFTRAFELGDLGIKAQTNFCDLTKEEKAKVETFLGSTIISNTLNLHFTIRNQKDAITYGSVVSNLANYYIKQSEISYFQAKTKNIEACTTRINDTLLKEGDQTNNLDVELLELLTTYSLKDTEVTECKSLEDLKNNDCTITPDNG